MHISSSPFFLRRWEDFSLNYNRINKDVEGEVEQGEGGEGEGAERLRWDDRGFSEEPQVLRHHRRGRCLRRSALNMVVTRVLPRVLILPAYARIPLRLLIFATPFAVTYEKLESNFPAASIFACIIIAILALEMK
jgi:hypothetical protein